MSSTRKVVAAVFLLVCGICASLLALYLAGGLIFLFNKQVPQSLTLFTWLEAWEQLAHLPQQRRYLQASIGIAAFASFGLPLLAVVVQSRKPRAIHGDARFATRQEVAKAGLLGSEIGIILGKAFGKFLIYPGKAFVFVAARTRSGKGVGIVIPNLLNWPDSVVVDDIKMENYKITADFRRRAGQDVFLFAPFSEDGAGHRFNFLDAVRRDDAVLVGDLMAIAEIVWPTAQSDIKHETKFWNELAANLFLGIALYIIESRDSSLALTFGEILRIGSGNGDSPQRTVQGLLNNPHIGGDCRGALGRFAAGSDNVISGTLSTFTAPLTVFSNPLVDAATSGSDFDLAQIRRRRMSVYLGISPDRLSDAKLLVNLFYSTLLLLNTRTLPEDDASLGIKCLLLRDEATAFGRVEIIAKACGYMAGYGLSMVTICQSYAQIVSVYGHQDALNLLQNHEAHVIFSPSVLSDAKEISERMGYATETVRTRSVSRPMGGGMGGGYGRSVTTGEQERQRALMLPQELLTMPDEDSIVLVAGQRPIKCRKVRYFGEKVFTERLEFGRSNPTLNQSARRPIVQGSNLDTTGQETANSVRLLLPDLPCLDDPENPSFDSSMAFARAVYEALDLDEDVAQDHAKQDPSVVGAQRERHVFFSAT